MPDGGAIALRPRSFGELFDHAITLYIRNFIPFALIGLVQIVPAATLSILGSIRTGKESKLTSLLVILAVFLILWPLTLGAISVAVSRLYRSETVEVWTCYRTALHRFGAAVSIVAIIVAIMIVVAVLALIVTDVFIGSQTALVSGDRSARTVAMGSIGLPVEIAMWTSLALLWLGMHFAIFSLTIEKKGLGDALSSGLRMAFRRVDWWKAPVLALGMSAIAFGVFEASQFLNHLFTLSGRVWVPPLVLAPFQVLLYPLVYVLLAVYYLDVRIRRDAIDVQEAFERLTPVQLA